MSRILLLTTVLILISCDENTLGVTKPHCLCFDGIGSTELEQPHLVLDFSNGQSVSVCGYKDDTVEAKDSLIISEFDVFNCESGESYARYGALETCVVQSKNDTLLIHLQKYLPSGPNWEWRLTQLAINHITISDSVLFATNDIVSYSGDQITNEEATNFLDSFVSNQGYSEEWENEICKLEVLSLKGNSQAWEILRDYEEFTGFETDGAIAETWKDALATVTWVTEFE